MGSPASRTGTINRRHYLAGWVLVCTLGTLHILPELANPVWQDEAATLMAFANRGFLEAFSDYSMPNNHLLFSASQALVWSPGDGGIRLRLLPLLSWAVTLALFAGALPRYSRGARLCAIALFSASAVTAAFALQLRGYAFSWPFALLACATAPAFVSDGRPGAALGFVVSSVALVAILPSNAMVASTCALWACAIVVSQRALNPASITRAATALTIPVLALGLYWPYLDELRAHASGGWSRWQDAELVGHWLLASLAQYAALAPALLLGIYAIVRGDGNGADGSDRHAGLLFVTIAVTIVTVVVVVPTALFPRALVPLLPLWCLALGALLYRAWGVLRTRGLRPSVGLTGLALVLVFVIPYLTPACAGFDQPTARGADLCQQYYRADYQPAAALGFLELQPRIDGEAIMLDTEAAWALGFLAWNRGANTLSLVEYRAWRGRRNGAARPRLVVLQAGESVDRLLDHAGLGRPTTRIREFADGGFEVWRLNWDTNADRRAGTAP